MSAHANQTWIVFDGGSWFVRRLHIPERRVRRVEELSNEVQQVLAEAQTFPVEDKQELAHWLALEMSSVIAGPYATLADVATCPHLLDVQCAQVLRAARQKTIPPLLDVSLTPLLRRTSERGTAETVVGANPVTCHDVDIGRVSPPQLPCPDGGEPRGSA